MLLLELLYLQSGSPPTLVGKLEVDFCHYGSACTNKDTYFLHFSQFSLQLTVYGIPKRK